MAQRQASACDLGSTFELFGQKHALTILKALFEQSPVRFGALKVATGVNAKTLTQRLAALQRHGLVGREEFHETPPRVEYRLTPMGVGLGGVFAELQRWRQRQDPAAAVPAPRVRSRASGQGRRTRRPAARLAGTPQADPKP